MDSIDRIQPGIEGRLERVVDGDVITTHVGGKGTFATPAMIGLMEITSHRSLENLLPAGHTTVGYEVQVRHVAPAAPGSTILVTTKLTEVKGNKLYFDVACHQGDVLLGSGTHKRAIVRADF
ncbi:MAG TPA: hotdog domain-containing protein [Methylomirabilota bacterium]|nr:hotdog domain-containing protein [Methylomirabilota bacterium]